VNVQLNETGGQDIVTLEEAMYWQPAATPGHLLDIESLSGGRESSPVLDTAARAFKAVGANAPSRKTPALRGKTVVNPVHRTFHPHPYQL